MGQITLVQILQDTCILKDYGITFIEQGDREEFLSYHDLYLLARKKLFLLQKRGIKPKSELVFQVEDNKTFIILFWSCILGGIVPVPLSIGKNDDQMDKLFNVWSILNNPYLVSTSEHLEKITRYNLSSGRDHLYLQIRGNFIGLGEFEASKRLGRVHQVKPTDLAFIQFSSGSTGSPKGIMLTHENLIANVSAIGQAASYSTTDSTLSWMPLTHDMGLIGFHINPLFSKMNQFLIPTGIFVRNPTLWLTKASEHQTTVICSPNFGYKYLLKYLDRSKKYAWDLSSIRIIYNGAEPISEQLSRSFINALTKYGLSKNAMCPVYGLAEASLAVSISDLKAEVISLTLDRNHLNLGDRINLVASKNALSFVNVGKAIKYVSICITDQEDKEVADEVVGYVKIRGKNVTSGYYNNRRATNRAISKDGWLNTGDLGFMKAGELYITGRTKDIFFINGQNFYPHDFERIAEEVEGIDLNKIVVSGATDADSGMEEVIAFVFHRGDVSSFLPRIQSLKTHINQQTGVELSHVIPVRDIPKTTSGKLQRYKLTERYKAGDYSQVIREINEAIEAYGGRGLIKEQPQNKTEQILLDVWGKLFNRSGLSVTDKFFEIGGNSLRAAEFAMIVLKKFEVELPLASMYDHQSIRAIAGILSSLKRAEYLAIPKVAAGGNHPVSSLQRRLFYFQEAHSSSTAYNVPVAFVTALDIEVERLRNCIERLIEKYDSLRTSFFQESQEVFMHIHDHSRFELKVIEADFSNPGLLYSLVTPFDLKEPRLFRICLVRNGFGQTLLFFDFHHIIIDGVSISFFLEELTNSYLGKNLNELFAKYVDFVHWSEKNWSSDEFQASKKYWLNELAGELPRLEMPTDRSRPKQFDYKGDKAEFTLSKLKTEKLRVLSKKYEGSMHSLIFSTYILLLHKYTGQSELVIGMPVTIRNHPDVSRSIGMFVNNLAIRVHINPEESFQELLGSLMVKINTALSHNYPFDLLVNDLNVKKDMSRNPLFDTMFLYQNMGLPSSSIESLQLKQRSVNTRTSKFDISLEVFDNGLDPLGYSFEYATSLFNGNTIQRLAAHFDSLLDRILINPESKIADISVLSVDEYKHHIFDFNDTCKSYWGQSILDLIAAQADSSPNAPAIICDEMKINFAELAHKSGAVALALIANGLKKGDIVAFYVNRSPELIVGILGIMKAGGVYLPIDTDLPEKRVEYLLSHSKCRWVLTKELFKLKLSASISPDVNILLIDQLAFTREQQEIKHLVDPSDLAYLLYTSGTTGKPKAVKVPHKALHNYISWAAERYVGQGKGSFPLFTSISFDLTITSIFTPLSTGYPIVVYSENENDEEHLVMKVLKDNRVDIVKLTPSHLRLLKGLNLSEIRPRKMILGGELFETILAKEVYKKFEGRMTIFNEYGPTEATVGCMIHTYEPEDESISVPIGVPAANTQIYLLDKHLHPVPIGVEGEIYIAGSGLAFGYLFDEALSAEKFIPNPFAEGKLMYKTGDLARRRRDYSLEYLDRIDGQVKINGYRIEPNEINYHILQCPGIKDAIVLAKELNHRKSLVAYLIASKDAQTIKEVELKAYLAERLPFYMIPARMVCVEVFPITGNGKIDHRALRAIEIEKEHVSVQLPQSNIEKIIAKVWEDLLGARSIALDDNFFEMGGDSIKAVQIVSRLHERGISVQAKDILTYHTIEQLMTNGKFSFSKQSIDQGVVSGTKAMTPIESWFFEQQFADTSYYNQSVLLNINQQLDLRLLQRAFEVLIGRHDGLRLNYDEKNRVLFFNEQHLNKVFTIPEILLEEEFTNQLIAIKSGFNISESLLVKAAVFTEHNRQKYLFITAHHLVTDGLSWRILLHDLSLAYDALRTGSELASTIKTESLVEWQYQISKWQPRDEDASKQYWERAEQAAIELPCDFQPGNWYVSGLKQHMVILEESYTEFLIKEAHKAYRTDVFTLLNVALVWTLNEWTGDRVFVIEHENHGRHLPDCDVSRTLGWFTAMYPVRLELVAGNMKDQVKAIKEQIRSVPDHGISYRTHWLKPNQKQPSERSEIRFNYLGEFSLELDDYWSFSRVPTGPESSSENHMTSKLELNVMVTNGQLSLDISYHTQVFRDRTINDFGLNFMSHLTRLLDQIKKEHEVHFTPSDFEAQLDQQELDELFM